MRRLPPPSGAPRAPARQRVRRRTPCHAQRRHDRQAGRQLRHVCPHAARFRNAPRHRRCCARRRASCAPVPFVRLSGMHDAQTHTSPHATLRTRATTGRPPPHRKLIRNTKAGTRPHSGAAAPLTASARTTWLLRTTTRGEMQPASPLRRRRPPQRRTAQHSLASSSSLASALRNAFLKPLFTECSGRAVVRSVTL